MLLLWTREHMSGFHSIQQLLYLWFGGMDSCGNPGHPSILHSTIAQVHLCVQDGNDLPGLSDLLFGGG